MCFLDGLRTLAVKEFRKYIVYLFLSEVLSEAYYKGVGTELSEPNCDM